MNINPIIALIAANVIWGIAAPVFKFSLENIPPFTLLFIRFFFAALLFLPALRKFKWNTVSKMDIFDIIVGGIAGFTLNIGLLFYGLKKADSIDATIIQSGAPIFLFFLAAFFLHEKIRIKVLSGMLIATAGILIIVFSPFMEKSGHGMPTGMIIGNLFYIASTFTNVLSIIILKRISEKISPLALTCFVFIVAAVTFFPLMLQELQTWSFSMLDIRGWVGIIYGLFISSALGYYLFYYGLSKLPSGEIGIFTYTDPLAALLVAAPLLHEYPNLYYVLGAVFVFGGIFLSEGRLHYHPFHKLRKKKTTDTV